MSARNVAKQQAEQRRHFGDFQTPPDLADLICATLAARGIAPKILIEPTCGLGVFIYAGLKHFPSLREIVGVDIHQPYCDTLQASIKKHTEHSEPTISIRCADIFTTDFRRFLPTQIPPTLVLGNPPWATNAALQGNNLPARTNIKQLSGLDALTGKSNFDIAEFITIKLLRECVGENVTFALLLKNSVIRNLIEASSQLNLPISNARAFSIDTKKYFGVDVAASLFVCECKEALSPVQCNLQDLVEAEQKTTTFGWYVNGQRRFVADIEAYSSVAWLDGKSDNVWRQGIKHDAAAVMELTRTELGWINKSGNLVKTEQEHIFPLVKSTQLARSNGRITETNRAVIVPQSTVGANTDILANTQPQLYAYLLEHKEHFAARKSSIYRNKPRFSIFGIGEYSFKPYKIAVSGLHKKPVFVLLSPIDGKPVMLDDTSYFLGFDSLAEAEQKQHILQSPEVSSFLAATAFLDAKRPFTKELLMRIDLERLAEKYYISNSK